MRLVGFAGWISSFIFAVKLLGQIPCPCDVKDPETLKERQCGLCAEAEKQPANVVIFFVHDNSPRKPNRWLALPREHMAGMHQMEALSPQVRAELWRDTIAKSKELWGEHWGIAYNAENLHTQCHVHLHIGKLIDGVEWGDFKVVSSVEEIPLPGKDGLWVHGAADGKMHVHIGEQVTENVLLR